MKLHIKYLLILPLWGLGGFAFAQTTTDSLLCRTWQVNWDSTYSLMSAENQTKYLAMPSEQQNQIKANLSNQIYTFNFNGELLMQWQLIEANANNTLNWQWDGQEIVIGSGLYARRLEIIQLSTQVLLLQELNTMVLFDKIYLVPQQ